MIGVSGWLLSATKAKQITQTAGGDIKSAGDLLEDGGINLLLHWLEPTLGALIILLILLDVFLTVLPARADTPSAS
ncbi:MAG: hypothetical protein H0U54_14705 [Acidobacteria bacterium]|nr:hypothetical protein [Acidobacteriota bacterium]